MQIRRDTTYIPNLYQGITMNSKTQHIHQACLLLRTQHSGVLSTHSVSCDGFPFGSITPFLLTEQGDIVIYASDIAQHSRNMQTHPKVSICIADHQQHDSQASGRVTLLGQATADEVDEATQQQYMQLFPQAKTYARTHDFRFYLIRTHKIRYIGGFGKIFWFSGDEWREQMYVIDQAQGSIEHMHQDHPDALSIIVTQKTQKPIKVGAVTMLSCFQHGFHYQLSGGQSLADHISFVPFLQPVNQDYDLRQAMVEITELARRRQAEVA